MSATTWRTRLIAIALPALLALAACSSESALCQSIDDLDTDVQALGDVDVSEEGIDALTTQFDAVEASFDEVKQEATDTFATDVDNVETSVASVQSIIDQVEGGTPLGDVAGPAAAAITALVASIDGLIQTVQEQECD